MVQAVRTKSSVALFRLGFLIIFVTICILVFGPFQGAESGFGLTDKEAHVIAFFGLTVLLLLSAPKVRRWDLAWLLAMFGGLIEIIQGQIGRDCDILDWVADCAGIAVVMIPIYVDRIRIRSRGQVIRSKVHRRSRRSSNRYYRTADELVMSVLEDVPSTGRPGRGAGSSRRQTALQGERQEAHRL